MVGWIQTNPKHAEKLKLLSDFSGKLEDCPIWAFDGSSTQQARGGSSDCLLKPVAIYPDPVEEWIVVMNEVLNSDGSPTNQMVELLLMTMMMILVWI